MKCHNETYEYTLIKIAEKFFLSRKERKIFYASPPVTSRNITS